MLLQRLLDAARKACLSAVWSQGVKLARDGAVIRELPPQSGGTNKLPPQSGGTNTSAEGELTLRVRAPGHAIAPTVTLYLEELEWSCDCSGKVDPCAHVAAAVIAVAASDDAGAPLATSSTHHEASPVLVYRLAKRGRALTLNRFVVYEDGREQRLTTTLASALARSELPAKLAPTHDDLRIDRILGASAKDVVPLARLADILGAMASARVTYEGAPVKTSGDIVLARAVVEDAAGGGFVLRLERDPGVTEVVAMGVARCGDVLRPLGDTTTTGEFLERLPLARTFSRAEETELVTRVLPELENTRNVIVTTARLPRKHAGVRPRIAMDFSPAGHTLSILPTLVYGDPPIARVDGDDVVRLGADVPVRRIDEERVLLQKLRDELNLVPGRRVDLDGIDAIRFAAKLRAWQEVNGDGFAHAVFEGRPLRARLAMGAGMFDVVFECDAGDGDSRAPMKRADAALVIRAWQGGLDLVPLDGGGWAPLPADWLAQHGHRVADLLAARDEDKRLPRAAFADLGELCEALNTPAPLDVDKLAPLARGFEKIPSAPLPEGLTAQLRAYQTQGHDWLAFLRDAELGGILADDMGLGKTLQMICALPPHSGGTNEKRGRTLVVCPKSVVYNWAAELARFRPALRVAIYEGAKREIDAQADVTLTTYALLRLDRERLASEAWDIVVLDEAQAIKNEASQTARAAFELRAAFRVALSGTPVENRLEELWSLMHFTNPGLLGGRSDFQERYAAPISSGDAAAVTRLHTKIRPFILRRVKREVLAELPPRTDAVLHVELDEVERSIYDAIRVATQKDIVARLSQGANVLAVLEALLRLRQAACHSALLPGQEASTSSKIERLLEALTELTADAHKGLVFSQWTSLLDLVEPHLRAADIAFCRIDGKTHDRAAVVRDFQSDAGPPVMLVSLKAGGTGLNLTAADHVFLLDPWWNPAVEDQAADRAHRIGQTRPVMVYRMVTRDTVEERIFALQEKKRAIANAALGGAVDHTGGITRDDLLALLEG